MGVLDTGGNVLLLWLWGSQVEPYMQAMHFFFGAGAFIAPLLIEASIKIHGSIAPGFCTLAASLALAACPLLPFSGPRNPKATTSKEGRVGAAVEMAAAADTTPPSYVVASDAVASHAVDVCTDATRDTRWRWVFLGLISLTLAMYVGGEVGYGAFIFVYAVDVRQ